LGTLDEATRRKSLDEALMSLPSMRVASLVGTANIAK